MSAYQNFLDFFSMHNKERLDGLSESYFTAMTQKEREMAVDYLLKKIKSSATEECIHGLFRADQSRAVEPIREMLRAGDLSGEAQIAAAWNLYRCQSDDSLLPIFINLMASPDVELREKAAYYVPSNKFTEELKSALEGMIRTETEQLARIHAVDKLLMCYGVDEESVGKDKYLSIYLGLHSEDPNKKETAIKRLDAY